VKVSDDLWTVLLFSRDQPAKRRGLRRDRRAADQTLAAGGRDLPEPELFNPAKAAVGYQFLKLDPRAHTAQLLKPNMRLDLGGIAKGYAADEALAAIRKQGIPRALVRGSGDIAVGDPPPGETGWKIGIAPLNPDEPPTRFVRLANMAISTSGDSRQHLEIGGKRYSHISIPHWAGLEGRRSVTVIASAASPPTLGYDYSILGRTKFP
jgi:thiamine biosynthesis lipoprotein